MSHLPTSTALLGPSLVLLLLAAGLGVAHASRQQQDTSTSNYPAAGEHRSQYKEHSYYGDYSQHSSREEEEVHTHHQEFDYSHRVDYPKRSYPSHPTPSIKSCGGRLPPTVCTATTPRASIQRRRPSHNDPTVACSSPGATYIWSPQCAELTTVGGTCKGSSLCQPGDVATAATATCTADGWVVSDDCYPCRESPSTVAGGNWSTCQVPGYRNQACTAKCDGQQPTAAAPPQVVCAPSCFSGGSWEYRGGQCFPPAVGDLCDIGTLVSADANGLVNGTMLLRGSLRQPTEVVPSVFDACAVGISTEKCRDLNQQVAVFKLAASDSPRNVTTSTCDITDADTVLQVLRLEHNGGACDYATPGEAEGVTGNGDVGPGCGDQECGSQARVDFTAAANTEYVVILQAYFCSAEPPREVNITQTSN